MITLNVCKSNDIPAKCPDNSTLFSSSQLIMEENDEAVCCGYLETQWMPQELCSPSTYGYGIFYQRVVVDKQAFITRVTRSKIILYLVENEMLNDERQPILLVYLL